MRLFVVVGTRPEAIKMAPVFRALEQEAGVEPVLVSTGQHREMLDQVFDWFKLIPDEDLEVMQPNQSLSGVLTRSLTGLDKLIAKHRPDAILAQGDTTTVMASALAAFATEVPFGHVEAGLRTYEIDSPYPEEGFRQMASRVTKWHFAPTKRAVAALAKEQLAGEVHLVGNTVIDALLHTAEADPDAGITLDREKMVLVTGHRRENHGARFESAFGSLADLAKAHQNVDFVYPVHLNPNVRQAANTILSGLDNIYLIDPVPYSQMVALMKRATLILTDSGGVQEEAPSLGVPVLVMRDSTERQEAVEHGVAKLVGIDRQVIFDEVTRLLTDARAHEAMSKNTNPFGDGLAAQRIAKFFSGRPLTPFTG